jgi:ketosteroid isomerase-like protein
VSEDNVGLALRALDAFAARDHEALQSCCDGEIEIQPAITRFEGTAFRGANACREFIEQIDDAWESLEDTPEQLTKIDDDRVMAVARVRARGRRSGVPADQRLVWVMSFNKESFRASTRTPP